MLRQAAAKDVPAILRYYDENRRHLAPYDPVRPPEFYTERYWFSRSTATRSSSRPTNRCGSSSFAATSPSA